MPVVLQITFRKLNEEKDSPEAAVAAHAQLKKRAERIAHEVPGLLWKIWIAKPNENVYGGTYLFKDVASAEAYILSPIPDDIRHFPEFTTTIFEIEEEFSTICHAPLYRPSSLAP